MSSDHGDRDLMAHHDGELGPDDERALALLLARDERARARLRGMQQVGDWVRLWAEEKSRDFDVSEQIMARVARPVAPARATARWLPAAATLALAAAVALLVVGRHPREHAAAPHSPVSLAPQTAPAPSLAVVAAPAPEPSVAIESVDFGAGAALPTRSKPCRRTAARHSCRWAACENRDRA